MQNIEHRHVPRTKLDKLAYIHIEPNNGGIILNLSGEGLGFHSIIRVERNGPIRFSLQEQNRRIDVCGELVWTDDVQKIGGLRFTALTNEARNQLQHWINSKSEPEVGDRNSTFGSRLLGATPDRSKQMVASSGSSSSYFARTLAWLRKNKKLKLSGFSAGLATGVLFSTLAVSLILLFYGHRRQFGESLIRIGERLAGNRDSVHHNQPAMSGAVVSPLSPASESALPASTKPVPPKMTVPVRTAIPVHSEIPARAPGSPSRRVPIQQATGPQTQPEASPAKPELKSESIPATQPLSHAGSAAAALPASVLATAMPAPASAVPTLMAPLSSVAIADRGVTPAQSELAVVVHDGVRRNSDSSLQMFFDLGGFKQEQRAAGLSDKLAQAGFPTSVVRKGHLWMNFYEVLVGPYNNEVEEKKINGDLRSRGYKPRPFERGSRDFAFRSMVLIERTKLPIGDFAISWESYVADAKVKFAQGHEVVATTDGKWIKKPQKYALDEYVYRKQADGSHPLLEIHFAGLDRALVFRDLP